MIEQPINKIYASWEVLQKVWVNKKNKEYSNDKNSINPVDRRRDCYYECKCLTCNITVRPVAKGRLVNGKSKSCHQCSLKNRRKKRTTGEKPLLASATYGLWQVRHRVWRNQKTGECSPDQNAIDPHSLQNKPYYECECLGCHSIKAVLKSNLVKGRTKSCKQCISKQKTMYQQAKNSNLNVVIDNTK